MEDALPNWNLVLLKDFEFQKIIGEGTYGAVGYFTDLVHNRTVAIKRIRASTDNKYAIIKIIREVTILRQISQMVGGAQHVVQLYDVLVDDSEGDSLVVYLVLEYMPRNLKETLTKIKDSSSVKKLMYRLLCAVNFLHSAGILHRDLKPENILVDDDLNVKLCDLGLSRGYRKQSRDNAHLARSQVVHKLQQSNESRKKKGRELSNHVMSRWYRPPEVILQQRYDYRADIWSLGCIFAEVLMTLSTDSEISESDKILFQGLSCWPLSPGGNLTKETAQFDMTPVIVSVLGDQLEEDLSFIVTPEVKEFVQQFNKGVARIQFTEELPGIDQPMAELLASMLEFNPYLRSNSITLLKNEVFDEVRDQSLEQQAPRKAKSKFCSRQQPFGRKGPLDLDEVGVPELHEALRLQIQKLQ